MKRVIFPSYILCLLHEMSNNGFNLFYWKWFIDNWTVGYETGFVSNKSIVCARTVHA